MCGCSDSNAPLAASTLGSSPRTVASEYSCVYEYRNVRYCGPPQITKDWSKACDPLHCPYSINRNITYPDIINGGTCSEAEEDRNVVDFAGSCDTWTKQGEPLDRPAPIYCGHSLFYNEFSLSDCEGCLKRFCPHDYRACYPMIVNNSSVATRCDGLIRCLRDCTPGNTAMADACTNKYADVVDAANAFGTCLSNNCSNECN
jgi:hypothetical protein